MSGTETFLRVGIDGTGSVTGARVVQRSMADIYQSANLTDKQIQTLDKSLSKIGTGANGLRTVKRDLDAVASTSSNFSDMLDSIQDRLIRVGISTAVFVALGRAISAVKTITQETLQYLGQIETSTLGIASSFLVSGKFIDTTTNKVLVGQRSMQAGMVMSKDVIEQLKVANMQTIATLDQLIVAYQVTLPVAMAKGFDKSMVMDFTLGMVQAAGAIGLPFEQMAEETRSLLTGTINPRTSRIATVLGLRNSDIAEYKGNAKGLFDFLMMRLEGFRVAGLESQKTWAGLWSNFKDIAKQGSSFAFEGMFEGVKAELTTLMGSIVSINTETKKINWNPEFIASAKSIGESITSIFGSFVTGTKFIYDNISAITKMIEAYLLYKITMISVSIAQAALNTEMIQSLILAGRVATGQASYISSASSDNLRAAEKLKLASAMAVETQSEIDNMLATRQNLLTKQAALGSGASYLATIEKQTLANTALASSELEAATARRANLEFQSKSMPTRIANMAPAGGSVVAAQKYTEALARQASLLVQVTAAKEVEHIATDKYNASAAISAKATDSVTAARERCAVITAELAVVEKEVSAAQVGNIATQEAAVLAETEHTASLTRLTVSQRLYSVGAGIATAATNLMNSAMALVGGPIGVAIIGVTALYWALYKLYNLQDTRKLALDKIAAGGDFTKLVQQELDANKQIAEIKKQRIKDELDARNATPEEREKSAIELATEAHKKNTVSYLAEEMRLREKIADLESSTIRKYKDSKSDSSITVLAEAKAQLKNVQQMLSENARKQVIDTAKAEALRDSMQKYVPNTPKVEEDKYNSFFNKEKYLDDLEKFRKSEQDIKDAYTKGDIQDVKDATKLELDELQIRYDSHLISMKAFIDAKNIIQRAGSQQEIMELEDKAIRLQNAADRYSDKSTPEGAAYNGGVKPFGGANAVGKEQINIAHAFNDAVVKRNELLAKGVTAWNAVGAAESKSQHEGLLNSRASIKAHDDEVKALWAIKKANDTIRGELAAFKASQAGTSFATGEVVDPLANEMANIEAAHDYKISMIQNEMEKAKELQDQKVMFSKEWMELDIKQSLLKQSLSNTDEQTLQQLNLAQLNDTRKMYDSLAKQAQTTFPKITAFQTIAHLMTKKYDDEKKKAGETDEKAALRISKAKLNMTSDYVGGASELFNNLASTMDTSSRSGFESAKALSMAGAVMSTAAAIMSQLAGGDPYTAWARAAMAGALGAGQIAMIASTSYGGGGSVSSIPTGSFGGGESGAPQSTIGGSIGAQGKSVYDSQSQADLQRIAGSMENASLALGKVADGLTDVADMFKDGSFMTLASGAAPGSNGISKEQDVKTWKDYALVSMLSLNPGTVLTKMSEYIFGGSWGVVGGGVTLGMENGNLSNEGYIQEHKKGGLFQSDSDRKKVIEGDAAFTEILQSAIDRIMSTINRAAAAMGTTSNIAGLNIKKVDIQTAGRTPEEISADMEEWFTNTSNELAKSVVGLKEFTFAGENAFDAIVRLSTALQSANESFELVGVTLFDATLEGANMAFKLQDMMGGVEEFTDAMDTYFTTMFTDTQQEAMKASQADRQVAVAFAEMNEVYGQQIKRSWGVTKIFGEDIIPPTTNEEFIKLVNSLDKTTERGAALFAALMDIAPAFALVQEAADNAAKALKESSNDLYARELRVAGRTVEADLFALRIQQESEIQDYLEKGLDITRLSAVQQLEYADAIKKAAEATKEATKAAEDKARTETISNALNAANVLKSIMGPGNLTTKSPETLYFEAKQAAEDALAEGRTTDLPDLIKQLMDASRGYNASGAGYTADYDKWAKVLGELAGIGGAENPTLSALERQITLLENISKNADITSNSLQGMMVQQTATNVMKMSVGLIPQDLTFDIIKDGIVDIKDALEYFRQSQNLPGFASGGITSGLSYAGEAGPEAIIPLPDGRSVPVRMTGQADNGGTVAELKEQNRLLRELLVEAKANTRINAEGFGRVVEQGEVANTHGRVVAQKANQVANK